VARRVACSAAGILWLALGVLAILTVFGTVLGLAMAWLVGVRRSVVAARVGAALGIVLFAPCQLIIDVTGCRHDPCGAGPYVLAYGIPALVVALNLAAGLRGARSPSAVEGGPDPAAGQGAGI
jgi:hypothetical protein